MRAAAAAVAALAVGGYWATATSSGTTLSLRLHYPMTCGQPGPGPLLVELPAALRIDALRVTVAGKPRAAALDGSTVTVTLPRPPQVTCMSIMEGTLPVTIAHVHAPSGSYVVTAKIRNRAFTARLRIP